MTRGGRRESDPRAEHLLARFAERFGRTDVPVPVDAVASDLLGLLVLESEDIEVSGLLVPASRYVFLNAREARESAGRRRFTLAHEIGHWVCQCDEGRGAAPEPILCREADLSAGGGGPLEREANNFAASLLMPEEQVRSMAAEGVGATDAAERFGVSDIAMAWRYYNLSLSDARP